MLASALPQHCFCGWEVGPTVRLPCHIAMRGSQVCSGLRASSRVSLPTLLKDSVPSSLLITHQQLSRIDGFGSILLQDGWVLFCTWGENELLVLGMLQGCCISSCSSLLLPGRSGCVGRGRSQDSSVGVSVPKLFTAVYSLAYTSMVMEGVSINQQRLRSHLGVLALGCQ